MGIQAAISYVVYLFINAFTPGPGNILALNTMTNYGWKRGKRLFFGIFTGYYLVQVSVAIFVFGLANFINPIMIILKYAGVIYILWLAYQVVTSNPHIEKKDKQPSFFVGFILQIVNVKIFLFGITALTGYVTPYYTSVGMLLLFGLSISTIGIIATLSWIFFGGLFKKAYHKYFRVVNVILALLLVECAVALFLQ